MEWRTRNTISWWLHDTVAHPITGALLLVGKVLGQPRVCALAHHLHNATAPSDDAWADYADAAARAACNERNRFGTGGFGGLADYRHPRSRGPNDPSRGAPGPAYQDPTPRPADAPVCPAASVHGDRCAQGCSAGDECYWIRKRRGGTPSPQDQGGEGPGDVVCVDGRTMPREGTWVWTGTPGRFHRYSDDGEPWCGDGPRITSFETKTPGNPWCSRCIDMSKAGTPAPGGPST